MTSQNNSAVEWGVLQPPLGRGDVRLVKGPVPSQEEAEAYRVALEMTRERSAHEHFMETSGVIMKDSLFVGWREVTQWTGLRSDDA